jgi:hypothetical protein
MANPTAHHDNNIMYIRTIEWEYIITIIIIIIIIIIIVLTRRVRVRAK